MQLARNGDKEADYEICLFLLADRLNKRKGLPSSKERRQLMPNVIKNIFYQNSDFSYFVSQIFENFFLLGKSHEF